MSSTNNPRKCIVFYVYVAPTRGSVLFRCSIRAQSYSRWWSSIVSFLCVFLLQPDGDEAQYAVAGGKAVHAASWPWRHTERQIRTSEDGHGQSRHEQSSTHRELVVCCPVSLL